MESTSTGTSVDVVKEFFTAFGNGDVEGIVSCFHPDCSITAVRKGERNAHYGSYSGREGVIGFLTILGESFETKDFQVSHVVGERNVAFASGSFVHLVRSTGKLFAGDWALMCVVQDGRITEYHFFEDSAAFVEANN